MPWMTLIGDLHGRTPDVRSDSYLVLLAGDIAPDDHQYDWLDGPFRSWLEALPCPCVAVGGNHDRVLAEGRVPPELPWTLLGAGESATVRQLRIFGCPLVLDGGHFRGSEEDIEACLAGMPMRCDILLSHNPPLGVLDTPSAVGHPGSLAMRYTLWKKRPLLHVFGHVHEGRGWARVHDTYCVNATLGAGCSNGVPVPARFSPWGLADESWGGPHDKTRRRHVLAVS